MTLQAIKGKVTGKQAGRKMLVRSLSGIGETAAMIVGAPSANSAFSENDLIRMRMADNIGNASDEQIMRMMTMAARCCQRARRYGDLCNFREGFFYGGAGWIEISRVLARSEFCFSCRIGQPAVSRRHRPVRR